MEILEDLFLGGGGLLRAQYKYLCMETEYFKVENFRYEKDKMEIL